MRGLVPVALPLLVCLAAAPSPARASDDPWWGPDKGLHLGVSAALSAGFYGVGAVFLDEPWERALFGGGVALGLGVAKELWDLAGNGDPSWRDVFWNVVGVATGLALALAIDLVVRAVRGSDDGAADTAGTTGAIRARGPPAPPRLAAVAW